jgi:hypothetical protein
MSNTEPTTTDLAVMAALERLADEHQRSSERAETPDERKFFRGWAGAFRKAACYYLQGIRPEQAPSTCYYVSSATRGGVVHHVDKMNHCTCEAGRQNVACWHAALVCGVEVAGDDLDRFDSADEPTDEYLWSDGTPVPLEMPRWLRGETRIAA